jgi:Holliday junction resolvase RusA-like endonuclease
VFDLPLPPSVNTTRKVDWKNRNRLNRWINAADAALMASGQFKSAQKNIVRFELHVVLDDEACRLDLDNGVKTLVDYLVRVGILANDSKKHWRKLTLEWGAAPAGCRITVKPLDD